MEVSLKLPENHSGLRVRIDSNGEIKLFDENDNEVKPAKSTRSVFEKKPQKNKRLTQMEMVGDSVSIGGLKELHDLDSFFVIDTSTKNINGQRVSVCFLIRVKLLKAESGYIPINKDKHAFVFEFYGVKAEDNPEMLAILKLANDVLGSEHVDEKTKIGIVTDSDMARHSAISNQLIPVYKDNFLPKNFVLIYAKDQGGDAINQLLGFCDKRAKDYLKKLDLGIWGGKAFNPIHEDKDVLFTCHPMPIELFDMGIIHDSTGNLDGIKFI